MTAARYAPLPPERSPDALERELLARWTAEALFERTLEATRGGDPWVFFKHGGSATLLVLAVAALLAPLFFKGLRKMKSEDA